MADADTARALRVRNAPGSVSSLSAALALAALRNPPPVDETIEERERLSAQLRALGFEPERSFANFVYVPVDDPDALYERLLREALVVRPFESAIRITVHERAANDRLLAALERR